MNVLEMIHDDHIAMAAIFQGFRMVLDEIKLGKEPDFHLVSLMLDYVIREPEELHHPKEDRFLFPKLRERAREATQLLEKLERQHHDGHKAVAELSKAYIQFHAKGRNAFGQFESIARRYIDSALMHIVFEEQELIPLAKRVLDFDDLRELTLAYGEDADINQSDFRQLFKMVASRLPKPYGVG